MSTTAATTNEHSVVLYTKNTEGKTLFSVTARKPSSSLSSVNEHQINDGFSVEIIAENLSKDDAEELKAKIEVDCEFVKRYTKVSRGSLFG